MTIKLDIIIKYAYKYGHFSKENANKQSLWWLRINAKTFPHYVMQAW